MTILFILCRSPKHTPGILALIALVAVALVLLLARRRVVPAGGAGGLHFFRRRALILILVHLGDLLEGEGGARAGGRLAWGGGVGHLK